MQRKGGKDVIRMTSWLTRSISEAVYRAISETVKVYMTDIFFLFAR